MTAKKGTANCRLCRETEVPSYFASPRRCAFDQKGIFTPDNWNCVTANKLRSLAGEGTPQITTESMWVRCEDQNFSALWVPPHPDNVPDGERFGPFRGGGGLIAMSWYKSRGCTEIMIRVDPRDGGTYEKSGLPLTVDEAEAAIVNLELIRSEKEVY